MAAADATIPLTCSCGARLRAPRKAIGRKARCPACAKAVWIEALAESTPAPLEAGPPAPMAAAKVTTARPEGAVTPAPDAGPATPARPAPMPAGRRTVPPPDHGGGDYARGVVQGAVTTIPAILIWQLAAATGHDLLFALTVGASAGWGTRIGCRHRTSAAGLLAASVAVAAVLATQISLFRARVLKAAPPELSREIFGRRDIETARDRLTGREADALLLREGLDPATASPDDTASAVARARAFVAALSDDVVRRRNVEYANSPEESDGWDRPLPRSEEGRQASETFLLAFGLFAVHLGALGVLALLMSAGVAYCLASHRGRLLPTVIR